LEREEVIMQQLRDANYIAASKKNKGKARAKDLNMDEGLREKYREAVEERKGSNCSQMGNVLSTLIDDPQRWKISSLPSVPT